MKLENGEILVLLEEVDPQHLQELLEIIKHILWVLLEEVYGKLLMQVYHGIMYLMDTLIQVL